MKLFSSLILFYCISISVSAQVSYTYSTNFHDVTQWEVNLKSHEENPSANAVVIYNIGKTNMILNDKESYDLLFEHRKKIKILEESGIGQSFVEIPFYVGGTSKEEVIDIEGYTYNYDIGSGKLNETKLGQSNIRLLSRKAWSVYRINFPNVKKGSIIEFRYKIKSPFKIAYKDWEFQTEIPVYYSRYEAGTVNDFKYGWDLQGSLKLDSIVEIDLTKDSKPFIGEVHNHKIEVFVMKDIPAFTDIAYITTKKDFISKLNFQLLEASQPNGSMVKVVSTWPNVNRELLTNPEMSKFIKLSQKKANEFVKSVDLSDLKQTQLIETLVNYIKKNYKWNGYKSYLPNKSAKVFLDIKTGGCAEINLFLLSLIKEVGLEAYPILLSTRENGLINPKYPLLEPFNYLAIYVKHNKGSLVIDGTEPNLSYNLIPSRCINGKGLIVDKSKEEWVSLSTTAPSTIKCNLSLSLNEQKDSLKGKYSIIATGYDGYIYRNKFYDKPGNQTKYFRKKGINISGKGNSYNYLNKSKPFTLSFKGVSPTENFFGKLYISPFAGLPFATTPLKHEKRNYPVDLTYPQKRYFTSFLNVPEGYEIEHLPKNKAIDNKLVKIHYHVIVSNGVINIEGEYTFKKSIYAVSEYQELRKYYESIIQSFNEKIVLMESKKQVSTEESDSVGVTVNHNLVF